MPEENKRHVVDAQTKQKPYCCRIKTKSMLLMLEQNKGHVVDAGTKQKPYLEVNNPLVHRKTIESNGLGAENQLMVMVKWPKNH